MHPSLMLSAMPQSSKQSSRNKSGPPLGRCAGQGEECQSRKLPLLSKNSVKSRYIGGIMVKQKEFGSREMPVETPGRWFSSVQGGGCKKGEICHVLLGAQVRCAPSVR